MPPEFRTKVFFVLKVVLVTILLLASLIFAPDVFLLIFAGLLVSIFFSSLADNLTAYTKIRRGWSLSIVVLTLISLFAVTIYFAAPSVSDQFDQLVKKIPESVEKIRTQIEGYSWGQSLLNKAALNDILGKSQSMMKGVGGAFFSLFGFITYFAIILIIGLYGAIEPGVYRRGILHLIPKTRRARIGDVISEVNESLKWWLVGKILGMAVIGILTTIGLWLLNIPLALILGIIAALLSFIPNFGPILAAVPALLLGLMHSPQQALYVGILNIGIQLLDNNLITPLVQKKTNDLAPALSLISQVFLGISLGGLGLLLAAPLTAAALVVTKMVYVEDGLHDHVD